MQERGKSDNQIAQCKLLLVQDIPKNIQIWIYIHTKLKYFYICTETLYQNFLSLLFIFHLTFVRQYNLRKDF